jgi:hypothetical protein
MPFTGLNYALLDERRELTEWATSRHENFHNFRRGKHGSA